MDRSSLRDSDTDYPSWYSTATDDHKSEVQVYNMDDDGQDSGDDVFDIEIDEDIPEYTVDNVDTLREVSNGFS